MAQQLKKAYIEFPGVAIVGAGPVGLLAGIQFRRRNFSVKIFEKGHDPRNNVIKRDSTLVLTSRGLNALYEVGLAGTILQHCKPLLSGRIVHLENENQQFEDLVNNIHNYFEQPRIPTLPTTTTQQQNDSAGHQCYTISREILVNELLSYAEKANCVIHFNHQIDHIDIHKKVLHISIPNSSYSTLIKAPRFKRTHFISFEQYKQMKQDAQNASKLHNDQPQLQQTTSTQQADNDNNTDDQQLTQDYQNYRKKKAEQHVTSLKKTDIDLLLNPQHTYVASIKADYIIGCDGKNSRVRQLLHQFLSSSQGIAESFATPLGFSLNATKELDELYYRNSLPLTEQLAIDSIQQQHQQYLIDKKRRQANNNNNNNNNIVKEDNDLDRNTNKNNNNKIVASNQNPLQYESDFGSVYDLTGSYNATVPMRISFLNFTISHNENIDPITQQPILNPHITHIWPRAMHCLVALPNWKGGFDVTLFLPNKSANDLPSIEQLLSLTNQNDKDVLSVYYSDILTALPQNTLIEQFKKKTEILQIAAHNQNRPYNLLHQLGTVQCYPWHYTNNVLLLGDAAHSMTPFYFQGLNFSLEDVSYFFRTLDHNAHCRVPIVQNGAQFQPFFGPNQASTFYNPYVISQTFSTISGLRKGDADAAAALSIEQFLTLHKLQNPLHLRKLQYEALLSHHFPTIWLPPSLLIQNTLIPVSIVYVLSEIQNNLINTLIMQETNFGQIELTQDILNTLPIVDVKKMKKVLSKKYLPILTKYRLDSHSLRDSTRDIVTSVMSSSNNNNNRPPAAKL